MATNATFPPYEMTTDAGTIEGIDVDTAQAIARSWAWSCRSTTWILTPLCSACSRQGRHRHGRHHCHRRADGCDVLLRQLRHRHPVRHRARGSDIASVDDLAGKKIGTQRGTTGYLYCSDDFGEDAVVAYDNGLTAVQA